MSMSKALLTFFKSGVPVAPVLIIVAALIVYELWDRDRKVLDSLQQEQVGLTENRLIYPNADDEVVLRELRRKAMQSYPEARRRFLDDEIQILFVRTLFKDHNDVIRRGYLRVNRIEDDTIYAAHIYRTETGYQSTPMVVKESEILDWLIYTPEGIEEGNLSGKYLLEKSKNQH